MRTWHASAVTLLAIASAGCVPYPHTVTLSPEISGRVELDGKPSDGVGVFLAAGPDNAPCDTAIQSVSTDSAGSFAFARRSQLRFLYAPLVAPVSVSLFTVCLRTERGTLVGYRGVTPSNDAKGSVMLHCDPSRPAQERGFDGLRRERACRDSHEHAATGERSPSR